MIKQINTLKNFGVYKNFNGNNLPVFNEKNIIYGWNYSGKTTLSRIFSSLQERHLNECFTDSEFKITLQDNQEITENTINTNDLKILVFNSDYIKNNLRWDSNPEINGITFDVGEAVGIRDKIQIIEKKIISVNGDEETISRKKPYKDIIDEFEDFENKKFTEESRSIKNDVFNSLIEFNKGHLKTILKQIKSNIEKNIILDIEELNKTKKLALSTNDKNIVDTIDFNIDLKKIYTSVFNLCLKEPLKTDILQILEENIPALNWVKTGINLHENKSECLFCGNNITEERTKKLKLYFGTESSKLREEIEFLLKEIDSENSNFSQINIPITKLEFYDNFQDDYEILFEQFQDIKIKVSEFLEILKKELLKKKELNIFEKQIIPQYDQILQNEIQNWKKKVNNLIESNNELYLNFDIHQNKARLVLQKHQVAQFLNTENFLEKETKSYYAQRSIERYDCYLKKAKREIEILESQLKSIVKGKEELNNFIKKFLNRDDIRIDIVNDDKFILKRGEKVAENLSEGEKTAISFSYFLVVLESLLLEKKIFEYIIFIDDPISSLDGNHIAQIYSLINSFFFRNGINPENPEQYINCFKQLFISTHNFEFFTFIKDSARINKKGTKEYYFVKRISRDESHIIKLPDSLKNYKSEYLYLFSIIHKFYENGCDENDEKFILMPNAIRRFLEIYTLMKLPGSTQEIDGRLKILASEPNELKTLHHFSHFTTFEKATRHDEALLNLGQATEELMTLIKLDNIHYESLLSAVDK